MKKEKIPKPGELWMSICTSELLCVEGLTPRKTDTVVFFYYLRDNIKQSRFLKYFLDTFQKYE